MRHGDYEEFAERVSHGASAVCALSLSARAGEIRAEPLPCVPDGRLPHVRCADTRVAWLSRALARRHISRRGG